MAEDRFTIEMRKKIRRPIKKSFTRKGFTTTDSIEDLLGCSYQEVNEYLAAKYERRYGIALTLEALSTLSVHHITFLETANTSEEMTRLQHHTNLELLDKDEHNQLHWKVRQEEHARIKAANSGSES